MRGWSRGSHAIGVDFGGTYVKVGLVDRRGRVLRTQTLCTRDVRRPSVFVQAVAETIEQLVFAQGIRAVQLAGVGIGAPGLIDVRRGLVHELVNVPGWHDVPLARRLAERVRRRCVVDNDANLVTIGEWRFGAGRGSSELVCFTWGTGIGGGLILRGRLYRGARDAAGELGHMVITPNGRRCACGDRGCLEAQVGTAAIIAAVRAATRGGRGTARLRRLVREANGCITPELVSRAAHQGDRAARAIWAGLGRWMGIGVANVVDLLNPDRVVIGGGVAKAWPYFAPALRASVREHAMTVPWRTVRVVRATLGAHAGIIGGAVLVWESV